jgi:hypothetical protein
MPSSLLQYHRNNINIRDNIIYTKYMKDISAFYSYKSNKSTYMLFVRDARGSNTGNTGSTANIYIETQYGSIIIPYKDLVHKYKKLYVYYIISLQLTPRNTKIYYCDIGYKGIYKELRNWYILTNICWKSLYLSFGDYCYFRENPLNINMTVCDNENTIDNFINLSNNENYEDPYKICDWLINHEIKVITNELYHNELIVNNEKRVYVLLQIVKRHFNINEDIMLKIYQYIVFDIEHKILI